MPTPHTGETQSKKGNCLVWGIVAVVAIAFVGRIITNSQSIKPPFSPSQMVLSSLPWKPVGNDGFEAYAEAYDWLTNDTIVYILPDGKKRYKAVRQRVGVGETFPEETFPNVKPVISPWHLDVTPQGKWLLLNAKILRNSTQCFAYALDGSGQKHFYNVTASYLTLLPDGESFVVGEFRPKGWARYSLLTGKKEAFAFKPQLNWDPVFSAQGEYFISKPIDEVNPAKLERGSLASGKSQLRVVPSGKELLPVELASVSPQGDQLLWYSVIDEYSWFAELFTPVRGRGSEPQRTETWYVTDADGNNRRTVTTLHYSGFHESHTSPTEITMKWLPDGKHLSAVYKGALYVVPLP